MTPRRAAAPVLYCALLLIAPSADMAYAQMTGCPAHSYGTAEIRDNVRKITCHCMEGYKEVGQSCVAVEPRAKPAQGPLGPSPPIGVQKPPITNTQPSPAMPAPKRPALTKGHEREECIRKKQIGCSNIRDTCLEAAKTKEQRDECTKAYGRCREAAVRACGG